MSSPSLLMLGTWQSPRLISSASMLGSGCNNVLLPSFAPPPGAPRSVDDDAAGGSEI
jgi:hypothetical protein